MTMIYYITQGLCEHNVGRAFTQKRSFLWFEVPPSVHQEVGESANPGENVRLVASVQVG